MPSSAILDSHIHLWPSSAANSSGHAWMTPGFLLSKQHILSDYFSVSDSVQGVVYIETDRRLGTDSTAPLEQYAAQPIQELQFLRDITCGEYGPREAQILRGIVTWAPLNLGKASFEQWITLAKQISGPETWLRIKGFRYLLQGITSRREFEALVLSEEFIDILKSFHTQDRNFSFDVGVDMRSGGIWQLEVFAEVIRRVHADVPDDRKTMFILNHMCKPDYSITSSPSSSSTQDLSSFQRWKTCMEKFSSHPHVYMKLSGAFSELSPTTPIPLNISEIASCLKPWADIVFDTFGPERIMFGSDWPVCNIKGPLGEKSWGVWKDVVEEVLEMRGCGKEQKERVWSGTAREAYRLDM